MQCKACISYLLILHFEDCYGLCLHPYYMHSADVLKDILCLKHNKDILLLVLSHLDLGAVFLHVLTNPILKVKSPMKLHYTTPL